MRECGECTLCCTLLAVTELGKTANHKCLYNEGQCEIYGARPQSCRDFECLWLQGQLPEEMKPSLCHVVVGATKDSEGLMVYVDPQHPKAHMEPLVAGMIKDAARKLPVMISIAEKKMVCGL